MQDGLPKTEVMSLLQDNKAYIWVGTKDGVSRFNGHTFKSFSQKENFPFRYISSFLEDSQHNVWAVSPSGLARFDGDSVECYPTAGFSISHSAIGSNDTIWFSAFSKSNGNQLIGYFSKGKYKTTEWVKLTNENYEINNVIFDNERKRVIVTNYSGIYEYYNQSIRLVLHPNVAYSFVVFATKIHENPCIIYRLDNGDCHFFSPKGNHWVNIGLYANNKWIKPISEDNAENIFCFLQMQSNNTQLIEGKNIHVISSGKAIAHCAIKDKDGTLWLGTENGLLKTLPEAFTNYKREVFADTWAITEYPKGKYWLASYGFGLKTFQKDKIKDVNTSYVPYKLYYYFKPSVTNSGNLFFPTNLGVLKIKGTETHKEHIKLISINVHSDLLCHTSYYDKRRQLLFCGYKNNVGILNDEGNLIRLAIEDKEQKIDGYISHISQDSEKNYWFCGNGIYHYNWNTKQLKLYGKEFTGLKVTSVFTDYAGRTWFSTNQGLLYMDSRKDKLQKFNSEEIMSDVAFVTGIDSSYLLFSQPYGIYTLDLKAYYHKGKINLSLYNEHNGYLGVQPITDGVFTDSDKHIWICSNSIVTKLNPYKLINNSVYTSLMFRSCNNRVIPFSNQQCKLKLNEHTAIIKFEAIGFNRPLPVQYSYKLNENGSWSPWQTEDYVILNSLLNGTTNLYVKVKFPGLTHASNVVKVLEIRANLAFYKQSWFIPLVFILLLIILIIAIVVAANIRAKLGKTYQKAKMAEAETIQAQMNPHFVFNVLATLQAKVQESKMDEVDTYLVKMAKLIRGFLNISADTTIPNEEKNNIYQHFIPLEKELKMLQEFIDFQMLLYQNTFAYEIYIDSLVDIQSVLIPPMLLQPFVENAIRHGLIPKKDNGILSITINKRNKNQICIRIADNGVGMEKAHTMHKESIMRFTSRGRSLSLRRIRLLNELGFKIEVETNSSSNGTVVTIKFYNDANTKN